MRYLTWYYLCIHYSGILIELVQTKLKYVVLEEELKDRLASRGGINIRNLIPPPHLKQTSDQESPNQPLVRCTFIELRCLYFLKHTDFFSPLSAVQAFGFKSSKTPQNICETICNSLNYMCLFPESQCSSTMPQ